MTSKELGFLNPSGDLKKKKHPRCRRVMLPTRFNHDEFVFIRNLGSSFASNYHFAHKRLSQQMTFFQCLTVIRKREQTLGSCQDGA
jgi:hypothetical protein